MTPKPVLAQQFRHFSCQKLYNKPPRRDPQQFSSQKLRVSQNLAQNLAQIRFGFTRVRLRRVEMGFARIWYRQPETSPTPHFGHYQPVQNLVLKMKSLQGAAGKFPRLHTTQPQSNISNCKATTPQLPDRAQDNNFQPKVTNPGREEPAASGKVELERTDLYEAQQYLASTILRRGAEVPLRWGPRSRFPGAWDSGFAVLFGGFGRKGRLEGVQFGFPPAF
ncbi:Hypothetical_protein [Hexamita inflata]|uniref:Hypothetical_protein n=1 Tax=Hexamita inflata TaxID=28002 RepID=A0AA86QV77_9EUKA|nr:Hypothetical protein HINF_LOCUS47619 [Hexamita inflata]